MDSIPKSKVTLKTIRTMKLKTCSMIYLTI